MTKENKELVLKDICQRVPYNTNAVHVGWEKCGPCHLSAVDLTSPNPVRIFEDWVPAEEVKPYLRPMSSMTEKERDEWVEITAAQHWLILDNLDKAVDWLNAHHFDYRGLIEKGLALEAPEGMYKVEE